MSTKKAGASSSHLNNSKGAVGSSVINGSSSPSKKKKGKGGSSVSIYSSSKLSGSKLSGSSRGNGPHASTVASSSTGGSKSIRVMFEGLDLTPLSLLDEGESLAVEKQESEESKSNIFASNAGIPNFSASGISNSKKTKKPTPSSPSRHEEEEDFDGVDKVSKMKKKKQGKATNLKKSNNDDNDTIQPKEVMELEEKVGNNKLKKESPIGRQGTLNSKGLADLGDPFRASRIRKLEEDTPAQQVNLQEDVTMTISESQTFTLFSMVGVCVGLEAPEHKTVVEQNEKYASLCTSREASDIFTSRPTQTLNHDLKTTEVSTGAPMVQDTGCQVSSWEIYDRQQLDGADESSNVPEDLLATQEEMQQGERRENDNGDESPEEGTLATDGSGTARSKEQQSEEYIDESESQIATAKSATMTGNSLGAAIAHAREIQVEKLVQASMRAADCLLPLESKTVNSTSKFEKDKSTAADQVPAGNVGEEEEEEESILQSESFLDALRTVERGIQQNVYHEKHLLYRAVPVADEQYSKEKWEAEHALDTLSTASAEHLETSTTQIDHPSSAHVDHDTSQDTSESTHNAEDVTNHDDTGIKPETEEDTGVEDTPSKSNEAIGTKHGISPSSETEQPEMQLLWKFQCEEAKGRTVSCMSWNKFNQDLLAVSYCQFQFSDQRDGLILFWTLKNPEYPERIIQCESGVCSIDFSTAHPSLLAAGMYDGTIAIYDLHREGPAGLKPVLDTSRMNTQHKDAVWQVKWVSKNERGEVLVSLSTDGRITEWSLKKGLASTDLMVLKRVHVPPELGGRGEGIISRTAAGLSLDFPINENGVYYAGTEDGTVHRCSVSYNEQYLETYFAHFGPVYKVRCSPFWPEAFLTCSADWSVRLWEPENDQPLLHFQSVDLADVVHDVAWSTTQSTVFGSVAGDGRVEIWDLSRSTLDPTITRFIDNESERKVKLRRSPSATAVTPPAPPVDKEAGGDVFYSSISFAYNAPIVVVGSSHGVIDVYRLRGLDATCESAEEAASILQQVVEQNQKSN